MRELQQCLSIKRDIDDINEKITELQAAIRSPKNQIMTGMPHGGGNNDNAIERYIIRLEHLQQKKNALLEYQSKQWNIAMEKAGDLTAQEAHLLSLRCIEGKPWKHCAAIMNKKYGKWSINKCFRVYGRINRII